MRAGTLEIQLIADVAKLQKDMRAMERTVKASNDNIVRETSRAGGALGGLGRSATAAGNNVVQFSRDVARLKASIDPAWASLQQYKDQVQLLRRALSEGAITHKQFVGEMRKTVTAYQSGGKAIVGTSGAMQAGFQQAGFQVSDFFVQVGGGTSAIRAASQQLPQLTQAVSLMGMGAESAQGRFGAFARFMSGPWGIAVTVGASILGVLAGALLSSSKSADDAEDSLKDLERQFDFTAMSARELEEVNRLLADSNREIERTSIGAANAARVKAERNREEALSALQLAKAEYQRIAAFSTDPTFAEGNLAYAGQLSRLEGKISEVEKSIEGFDQQVRRNVFNVQVWTSALDDNGRKAESLRTQINDLRQSFEATGNAKFLQDAVRIQQQLSDLEGSAAIKTKQRLTESEKTYKKQLDASQSFIESLEKEIAEIGMSPGQLRQLEIARAQDAAATDEQRKAIELLNQAREEALSMEARREAAATDKKATAALDQRIKAIQDEMSLLGIVGPAREKAALALEEEAFKAKAASDGILDVEGAWQKYLRARSDQIDMESVLDRDAAAAERLNDQFRDMISLVDRLGGVGSVLGSILAVGTGNYNSVARGPVGDILAYVLNQQTGWAKDADNNDVAILLGDELRDIFGKNGLFGQTLGQSLANAGLGYAASSTLLGRQSGIAGVTSGIGGALGGGLTSSSFGGAFSFLGKAAGPVGAIAGGLLGGLIGGLFGGTPKGVVGIGGSGSALSVYGTKHSNSERTAAATQAADSVIDTIKQLAEAFNGTVNAARASVTLGMRDDQFVVDTLGQGRTHGAGVMNFGQDRAAAVKAAMMDLLKDGVIDGIRDSTMRLIRSGRDLEEALAWEQVLSGATQASNSFAAEMKALGQQFEQIALLAQAAGASTQEYASIQAWFAQQQQALIAQASASYRSTFYSDSENLAFARQTISDTLTPFGKGNIRTVAQYKALVNATDAIASPELYGALMDLADEFALIKEAAEAAAQAKQAKRLQAEAEKEQELADARALVAQAYARESGELEQTIDRLDRLGISLRDLRDSIYSGDSAASSLATSLARLRSVGALAGMGDEAAAGQLGGVVRDYLSAARATSATRADFQMAQALAARYVDSAFGATAAGKGVAEQQLAELKTQAQSLGVIENAVVSMAEAAERLNALLGGESQAAAVVSANTNIADRIDRLGDRLDKRLAKLEANTARGTISQNKMASVFDGADAGNMIRVRVVADDTNN